MKRRRLIMWSMFTLGGLVRPARTSDVDQHLHVWAEDLQQLSVDQSKSVGALLFGRATYEIMSAYWSTATGKVAELMHSTPKVVFSRSLKHADWNNTRLVAGNPETEIASMKRQPGRDLLLLGSGNLAALLVEHGLVDEWRLGVSPVVLGGASAAREPRMGRSATLPDAKLLETRSLASGCLILRYARVGRSSPPRQVPARRLAEREGFASPRQATSAVDGPFAETKEWPFASRGPGGRQR
jgi:dihydrofolate reductase